MLALCAIALNISFVLVFVCLCAITAAAYALVALQQKQRRMIDQTGVSLGNFMRGALHARVDPQKADDEFSRLQHRINNLLDLIDLHLRGQEAAIDLTKHAEYADKLKLAGLSDALAARSDSAPETAPAAQPETVVGSFLKELRQQATDFFQPTEETVTTDDLIRECEQELQRLQRQAQQASSRLQVATTQLAQRAMQPVAPEKSPRGSMPHMEAGCARMAEQATVLSLNIAIEAGRAPADSPLHGAMDELRGLAKQLQQLRAEFAQGQATADGPAVATVPLSHAMEALTSAEQQLRAQQDMIEQLLARLRTQETPDSNAEAA